MVEILFVGNLPKPFGGVATHCLNLVKNLAHQGVGVHFLDTKPRPVKTIPPGIHYSPIRVSLLTVIPALIQLLEMPRFVFSLYPTSLKDFIKVALLIYTGTKIIKNNPEIELIHSQHTTSVSLAAAVLKRKFNLKLIVTAHGAEITDRTLFSKYSHVISKVIAAADQVICVSNYTAHNLIGLFPAAGSRIKIIPNGVEKQEFQPTHPILRKPEILFVGDIHPRKGADTLVEAFKYLNQPEWHLHIVGTPGSGLEKIKNQIRAENIEDYVEISTNLTQPELINAYARATIFVFPTKSNTEGFGLVAIEAMASGLAVVASRIAAIPEIVIDEINGLLFSPGDAHACAKTINRLIDDPQLVKRLTKEAESILTDKYNWQVIASNTIAEYKRLLVC